MVTTFERECTVPRTHRRTRPLPLPDRDPRGWVHQLRTLPPETLAIMEMLSVLNVRIPLAQLGQAAEVGLAELGHRARGDLGIGGLVAARSRPARSRFASSRYGRPSTAGSAPCGGGCCTPAPFPWSASRCPGPTGWPPWTEPDEGLAATLERLAAREAADGRPSAAATHLRWASDISPARADRERRLLTAAQHLTLAGTAHGPELRQAVEAAAASALRSYVLGTMAYSAGQLAEAERRLSRGPGAGPGRVRAASPLAALIASGLAGAYSLLGDGQEG